MELHRHRPALRVEGAREPVVARGPVEVVRHVIFARPHELEGGPHRLRDLHRLGDEVHVDAPPEATAQVGGAHGDLLGLEARHLRRHSRRHLLELGGAADQARVLADVGREVHRLHRGVGEEGQLVGGLHGLCGALDGGVHVALLLEDRAGPGRGRLEGGGNAGGVERLSWALVPGDGERLARALGAPPGVGHHGDAVGDLPHVLHPRHRLGPGGVEAHRLAADHRALREGRVEHAGQLDVEPELGRPVDLGRGVEAVDRLADVPALLVRLQLHVLGDGQLGGGVGQLAVGGRLAARAVDHRVLRAAGGGLHAPFLRRRRHQHGARLGAGDAQIVEPFGHRGGAARDLAAQHGVDVGLAGRGDLDLDLAQVDFELLGHEGRHRGVGALAHLGARREDRDAVVAADLHPGVRHGDGLGRARGRGERVGQGDPQHEAPAHGGARLQEFASGRSGEGFHGHSPLLPAALWMAARMRG